MKHCPNESCEYLARTGWQAEFVDAIEVCSDCGASLAAGDASPAAPPTRDELVTIYQTNDQVQAHLVRFRIEEAGIPVHIAGESLQGAMGELPLMMLSIRVQVPASAALEARRIATKADARG